MYLHQCLGVYALHEGIRDQGREEDPTVMTQQHSVFGAQLAPRVPFSTCWYGAYVEVEAKDKDVEITSLYSQTVLSCPHVHAPAS